MRAMTEGGRAKHSSLAGCGQGQKNQTIPLLDNFFKETTPITSISHLSVPREASPISSTNTPWWYPAHGPHRLIMDMNVDVLVLPAHCCLWWPDTYSCYRWSPHANLFQVLLEAQEVKVCDGGVSDPKNTWKSLPGASQCAPVTHQHPLKWQEAPLHEQQLSLYMLSVPPSTVLLAKGSCYS